MLSSQDHRTAELKGYFTPGVLLRAMSLIHATVTVGELAEKYDIIILFYGSVIFTQLSN